MAKHIFPRFRKPRFLSLPVAASLFLALLPGVSAPSFAAEASGNASVTLVSASAISFDRSEGAVLTPLNEWNAPVDTASLTACLTAQRKPVGSQDDCVPLATVEFF